jgi:hypothetical protein
MVIDTRKDWDSISPNLRLLLGSLHSSFPDNGTDEEWAAFEEKHPITIGYGDRVLVLPNCAQSYNALEEFLNYAIEEFEA